MQTDGAAAPMAKQRCAQGVPLYHNGRVASCEKLVIWGKPGYRCGAVPGEFRVQAAPGATRALPGLNAVHIHLREGNGDALFVEAQLDLLVSIPVNAPEIGSFGPGAYQEVDTGIGQFAQSDHRRRVFQYALVRVNDLLQQLLGLEQVVAVGNAKYHIDAPCVAGGIVGDVVADNGAVGNDHLLVIGSGHGGGEDADLVDHAAGTPRLDVVSLGKWPEYDQHYAGCQIRQGTLQREPDREAGSTKHCHQGRGVDTELAERGDYDKEQEYPSQDTGQEVDKNLVHAAREH